MMFAAPLALFALALLPPLYFLLRLTPPAPRKLRFPPITLLADLPATQQTTHRLPLWLLLLRLGAATLLIIGFAGPTLRPPPLLPGAGPILLVIDNGWASAPIWAATLQTAQNIAAAAQTQNRPIALLATARDATGAAPHLQPVTDAATASQIIAALMPNPWPPDRAAAIPTLNAAPEATRLYLADGLTDGPGFPAFLNALRPTRIFAPGQLPALLGPPAATAPGVFTLHALSNPTHAALLAQSAVGATLARAPFGPDGAATITLPPALAGRIAKFTLDAPASAGATALTDSSLAPPIAGLDTGAASADTPYLGTIYYLRRALPPGAALITGPLERLLAAKPGVIFLADIPLTAPQISAATAYIQAGGILVRFAGPLTAQAMDPLNADPLINGDRRLGGTLTWATPETLAPFPAASPFAGLPTDPQTSVSQQILADPTSLAPTTIWASLHDGTPLVLGKPIGRGTLVNILTTANTGWSNLALSGLFPAMLARLATIGQGAPTNPQTEFPLQASLTAFGTLGPPASPGATLTSAIRNSASVSAKQPPGLYGAAGSTIALNLGGHVPPPQAAPLGATSSLFNNTPPISWGPSLIALATFLLCLDLLISLALRGALRLRRLAILALLCLPAPSHADPATASLQTELGYIQTGDPATDQTTSDALTYLSADVSSHSSVQLGPPAALNPETDDLAFYPLIYWQLLPTAPALDNAACAALATYMSHGGLLIIDMPGGDPDSQGSGAGLAPGAAAAFRRATACLNLPPLEPLTTASVLAHSFYIIPGFPGRFTGAPVLIATAAARDPDGVTPVIIAQNDWAAAWARDANGAPEQTPLPGGEAQRLIADRFGINLVIYALTGSYKGDQNSAPALLDKLGQ